MDQLVSVIIPCHNVETYVGECVASVLNQSYTNLEIICIDNNSEDHTWNRLLGLKHKHPSLIIDRELKAGANAARNKGLSLARGEWIQFLDADDLLEPGKIEHQLQLIESCKNNIVYIAAACKRRDLGGREQVDFHIESNQYLAAFINKSGNTCSNLWKAKALRNVSGWNENIRSSQEADLMMRLLLAGGGFLIDPEPLTIIRERESGQISKKTPEQNWKRYIDVRLSFLKQLQQTEPEQYQANQGVYQDSLMVSILTLARYNPQDALAYYNTNIKGRWRSSHRFGLSPFKVKLIKLLGLKIFIRLVGYKKQLLTS